MQHTLSSLLEPFVACMLNFCSSCTMRPQKRLKVRGSRTCGWISSSTPFTVRTNNPCASTHVSSVVSFRPCWDIYHSNKSQSYFQPHTSSYTSQCHGIKQQEQAGHSARTFRRPDFVRGLSRMASSA